MYETYTTIIGTVVSEPRRRQTTTGEEVISFRVACNSRRIDKRSREWIDGPTLYLTVSCWRRLLVGVGLAVAKGRPVIAHGQIKTNEYVTADGEKRSDLEMTANAVGLDLSRCVVSYQGIPGSDRPQVVETADQSAQVDSAPTAA
ncbi:single-stranded DNA-binding protein [Gordonia sp. SID5947]|uniref:single-stranded DNA-binding protein n=1 Tax=Gordonia sp. SID5947 TaxID=2690315 RepID=UPI001368E87F|nr:single-stranded DNA-binding protein [Gordonia sp. SID5947]MYR05998.1 single-stranded DNA-binding protein [Gordonia sp. SID5947]